MERKLTAILCADVVGYSRLMGRDEAGTLAALKSQREGLIQPKVAEFSGRIVKLIGDGVLAEFASVVEAVKCAIEIQRALSEWNAELAEDARLDYRVGINVGDVIIDGDDIYGDGVNVAARLEGLAEPGGICLSRTARDQVRDKLDLVLDDLGEVEVKNIARPVRAFRVLPAGPTAEAFGRRGMGRSARGWLIGGAVLALLILGSGIGFWLEPRAPALKRPSVEDQALSRPDSLPERPSIAVLPFANISDDAEQEYLADGMTDDLITDLSKVSGLFVIARNSVFTYKGRAVNVQEVARELGVRYVLEGSVRRAGDRVRVNAQLIDATSGHHLWAERYDRDQADLFAMQDEVIGRIVSALAVQLTHSEEAQLARIPTDNLEAYDYYLRAEQEGFYTTNVNAFRRTLSFYERAIQLDPGFADAYAGYARTNAEIWHRDFSELLPAAVARKRVYETAGKALSLDPENARAYSTLALVQLVESRHEEAIASARKAVSLHPNNAGAQANLGLVLAYSGYPAEAASAIEMALRLNPKPPVDLRLASGIVFYIKRQYDRAIEALETVRNLLPSSETPREFLAAAYAQRGKLRRAKAELDRLVEMVPIANLAYYRLLYDYYRREKDREHHIEGLRKAGLTSWPFGFEGRDEDRLDEEALEALTMGQTWVGNHARGAAFIQAIDESGNIAYRSANSFLTGTLRVWQDMICQQFEGYFLDRVLCGFVYRNTATAEGGDYVYVTPEALKYFSLKK